MHGLRQAAISAFLRLLIVALFLSPTFVYAQKQSMVLPPKYADLKAINNNSLRQMVK